MKKVGLIIIFLSLLFIFSSKYIFAQNSIEELQKKIIDYENKLTEIRKQKNTLSNQIQLMDTQIYLTNLKIQETEKKIEETQKEIEILDNKINNLDNSLNHLFKTLIVKVNSDYKQRSISLLNIFLETNNFSNFFRKVKYIKSSRENNQKLIIQVQQAKTNFQSQKTIREEKTIQLDNLKKILNEQKSQLDYQKLAKQKLLLETNNDEINYQRLLSQARAQLASFTRFVNSQGGASILYNQTSCDSWGCYYNQRDSQWGNFVVNNSYDCNGPCTIARIGCLITSVAILSTHLGFKISPLDIAINYENFWLNTAYLKYTNYAAGKKITREIISKSLTPEIVSNSPVIIGIYYGEFGTHFLIIKSYSDGKYIMNDPYIENGKDKIFTDYYSLNSVFSVERIRID